MLQNISAAYNSGSLEQDKSIEMAAARKPSNDVEAEPFIQEEEDLTFKNLVKDMVESDIQSIIKSGY